MNFENYNISSFRRNSECNLKKDERLNYCLSVLGLEQLINLFFENNISFIDLLFLTRNDLFELDLGMYQRNRIIQFSNFYKKIAINYSLNELKEFFKYNKQFIFNFEYYENNTKEKYYSLEKKNKELIFSDNDISLKPIKKSIISKNIINFSGLKPFDEKHETSERKKENLKLKNINKKLPSEINSERIKVNKKIYIKPKNIYSKFLEVTKQYDNNMKRIVKEREISLTKSKKINSSLKKSSKIKNININNNIINKNNSNECKKMLNKIENLENMKMDKTSNNQLNEIKKYIINTGYKLPKFKIQKMNLELDDLLIIEKEIENLQKYNSKIDNKIKKRFNKNNYN